LEIDGNTAFLNILQKYSISGPLAAGTPVSGLHPLRLEQFVKCYGHSPRD